MSDECYFFSFLHFDIHSFEDFTSRRWIGESDILEYERFLDPFEQFCSMIWFGLHLIEFLHLLISCYMYECLLEFLKYRKYRPIDLLRKSYKEKKRTEWECPMDHEVYTCRECDRLSESRDESTKTIKYYPKFAYIILSVTCEWESVIDNPCLMLFARKNPYDFQICKCIDDTIEEAIPISISYFLSEICCIAKFLDSPNCNRKEYERYQCHTNIDHESRDDEYESHEKLRYDMEHPTISNIPHCFARSIDDLLLLTMLKTDMIVDRKSEHHLHRSHEKSEPIGLYCFE